MRAVGTVDENAAFWAGYDWTEAGEEWSEGWGGSHSQWYGVILPRVARFLPAGSMLEIAPGHGRWTAYLREHCETLAIVDLDEACIEACRQRFRGDDGISCHVNDGRSLAMIADESVDFAFSFDSLVHADADVIAGYLRELARVLAPDGVAFVHHSNAGRYRRYFEALEKVPQGRVRERLFELRILDRPRWRALDMTAERFRESCRCRRAPVHQPGDRQLDDAAADRLPVDLHETVVPLGPPEPRLREPGLRGRGPRPETPCGHVCLDFAA